MIKPNREIGERAYEPAHIAKVLHSIAENFPLYFDAFAENEADKPLINNPLFKVSPSKKSKNNKGNLDGKFRNAIAEFEKEQPLYRNFFDLETLLEYQDDPNTFKKDFSKRIPILNRCMNSRAKEMQRYQVEYRKKTGKELLTVTHNIILFGNEFAKSFDGEKHEAATDISDLGLTKLLQEEYISYQVIGGGIKSHFLYSLYPGVFANRSQEAIWALWYLTAKNDFGFNDGSEFLMVDLEKNTTQQNYHYPYDLFSYYALKIYLMLRSACREEGVQFLPQYRYIYLDVFLSHISRSKQTEIIDLKKSSSDEE